MPRPFRLIPVIVILLPLAVWLSCSRKDNPGSSKATHQNPDVLLVSFDTTRADHLGPYGYKYAFTPTLDDLARKSVKFNRAFSPIPLTCPSHTTILTGLYPFYHGVRDNSHFVASDDLNTLPEAFKAHGYQTAAMVSAFVLDSRFGLAQGFDTYDDAVGDDDPFAPFNVPERTGGLTTDRAIKWLESAEKNQPFFMWVHFYDPHAPYRAPDNFTRYSGLPYDVEIAYADSQLGRLLDYVDQHRTNPERPLLMVFVADHGEALGENGELTHAYFAYDSTLHVPLIIKLPDGTHGGMEIDTNVSLVDLMPTILDLAGLPVPKTGDIHGRSLVPLLDAKQTPSDFADRAIAFECLSPHYAHGWAPLEGIRVGDQKLIVSPKPELYDFSENPREDYEIANLYDKKPELVAKLMREYRDLFDGRLSRPPQTLTPQAPDPETVEKLRALGYVAAQPSEPADPATGKDLKDMLGFFLRTNEASARISGSQFDAAVDLLIKLVDEEPKDARALWLLAQLGTQREHLGERVLPILEKAITEGRFDPNTLPQMLVNCGRIYLMKSDYEKSLKLFGDAAKMKEDYPAPHSWLGATYLRLNRFEDAITALNRAAEIYGPKAEAPWINLGLALVLGNHVDEGVAQWSKVLEKHKPPPGVWWIEQACALDPAIAPTVARKLKPLLQDTSHPQAIRTLFSLLYIACLGHLNENAPALALLEELKPFFGADDINLLLREAGLNRALQRDDAAHRLLERAYELKPEGPTVVLSLASLLEQLNEIDRAVEILSAYYDSHSQDPAALNNLAWMLAQQGKDLDRALKLAKRARDRQPGNPSAVNTLGWVYHLRGDREMAAGLLKQATVMAPEKAIYQYHLGMAYNEAGAKEQARQAFTKAVELAPTPRPAWYEDAVKLAAEE